MGDLGARLGGDQRRDAGIAEEIEYLQRPSGCGHLVAHPRPVGELFGKDADMAEGGEPAKEIRIEELHRPGLAEHLARETPTAHAVLFGIAGKDGIGPLPYPCRQGLRPKRLGLGANDAIGTVLFELSPSPLSTR